MALMLTELLLSNIFLYQFIRYLMTFLGIHLFLIHEFVVVSPKPLKVLNLLFKDADHLIFFVIGSFWVPLSVNSNIFVKHFSLFLFYQIKFKYTSFKFLHYHKETNKHETKAFTNPPKAWITRGISNLNSFFAIADLAIEGSISP